MLDLARFAGTPLADLPDAATLHARLAPILETDFRRTRWEISPQPGSRVEVSLDEGRILARGRESPVEEIELEVLEGPVSAAFDIAEALAGGPRAAPGARVEAGARPRARRHGPAEAGARHARIHRGRGATRATPRMRIAAACLAHAQANEAGVLESNDVEFVHQLRVAFRRLRSALRLFGPALVPGEDAGFAEDLRWAAGILGRCRDWDVFVTETLPPLVAAQGDGAAGRAIIHRARARQRRGPPRRARGHPLAPLRARDDPAVALGLDTRRSPEGLPPLKDFASERLRKGARRVAGQSEAFAALDAAGRHRLRILVKRQRYAAEFLGSLFRAQAVKPHVRALARAQDTLGLANDCANALAHVRELAPPPDFLAFARGWFAAREAAGIEAAGRELARAATQKRFWRRKPPAPEGPPPA